MPKEQASKVLDEKVRTLCEDYETKLYEAFGEIAEKLQPRVEALIERFGVTAVRERMKRHSITASPGGTIFAAFRPMLSGDQNEESWDVDEEA